VIGGLFLLPGGSDAGFFDLPEGDFLPLKTRATIILSPGNNSDCESLLDSLAPSYQNGNWSFQRN
jgi:hypothetical protein